jgi:hypothetical protein
MRQFKLSNDPQFVAKLRDIVGLYVNPPDRAINPGAAAGVGASIAMQTKRRELPRGCTADKFRRSGSVDGAKSLSGEP